MEIKTPYSPHYEFETAQGDPNSTAPQPDVIKAALRAKILDPATTTEDREAALAAWKVSYGASSADETLQSHA